MFVFICVFFMGSVFLQLILCCLRIHNVTHFFIRIAMCSYQLKQFALLEKQVQNFFLLQDFLQEQRQYPLECCCIDCNAFLSPHNTYYLQRHANMISNCIRQKFVLLPLRKLCKFGAFRLFYRNFLLKKFVNFNL